MVLDGYDDFLRNEIEVLSAVYDKELTLQTNKNFLKIVVNLPMESIKDSMENFINLTLEIICKVDYPLSHPSVCITGHWGLEDSDVERLYALLRDLISAEIRNPEGLIYRIIQTANDYIDHNIPTSKCSICLDSFIKPEDIYATPNHHFFHKICIETFAALQIEEHNMAIEEAKKNNPFIELKDLPKLDMRCPICRSEELLFDKLPNADIRLWRDSNIEITLNTFEVNEYLKKMSLEMQLRKEGINSERELETLIENKSDDIDIDNKLDLAYTNKNDRNSRLNNIKCQVRAKGNVNTNKGYIESNTNICSRSHRRDSFGYNKGNNRARYQGYNQEHTNSRHYNQYIHNDYYEYNKMNKYVQRNGGINNQTNKLYEDEDSPGMEKAVQYQRHHQNACVYGRSMNYNNKVRDSRNVNEFSGYSRPEEYLFKNDHVDNMEEVIGSRRYQTYFDESMNLSNNLTNGLETNYQKNENKYQSDIDLNESMTQI